MPRLPTSRPFCHQPVPDLLPAGYVMTNLTHMAGKELCDALHSGVRGAAAAPMHPACGVRRRHGRCSHPLLPDGSPTCAAPTLNTPTGNKEQPAISCSAVLRAGVRKWHRPGGALPHR